MKKNLLRGDRCTFLEISNTRQNVVIACAGTLHLCSVYIIIFSLYLNLQETVKRKLNGCVNAEGSWLS